MKDHNERVKANEKYRKDTSIASNTNLINNMSISADEINREKQDEVPIDNS